MHKCVLIDKPSYLTWHCTTSFRDVPTT